MYFCNLSRVTSDINPADRYIFVKKVQKCNEKHILQPLTFTVIMLSSIQTVEIPQKLTVCFNNSCSNFKFLRGTGKNDEKKVLNQ